MNWISFTMARSLDTVFKIPSDGIEYKVFNNVVPSLFFLHTHSEHRKCYNNHT